MGNISETKFDRGQPRFTAEEVAAFVKDRFSLDVSAQLLNGEFNQNYKLNEAGDRLYLMKIFNRYEHLSSLEAQTEALDFLAETELKSYFPGIIPSRLGEKLPSVIDARGEKFYFQMQQFLPGRLLVHSRPLSVDILQDLGCFLGRLDKALQSFYHPATERKHIWDLSRSLEYINDLDCIKDPARRRIAAHFMLRFEMEALPVLLQLRRSVIHNDANDYNLFTDGQGITGLVDFGDMILTHTVIEIAIAMAYVMMDCSQPLETACAVLAGYCQVFPLQSEEIDILYYLITARLCSSVIQSARSRDVDPENEYRRISETQAWLLLEKLYSINPLKAAEAFRIAGRVPSDLPGQEKSRERLLKQRERYISPALSIHYRQPLHIRYGAGPYLFDAAGKTYLDLVNNVCHVGHCHPVVVRTAQKQLARLNTNTRYLYDQLSEYACRLTATLPDPLNVCFFTCTGSEANDLAWRIACTHTGGSEAVVIDMAYHGNTTAVIGLSPYKFEREGGSGAPDHVHKVAAPDTYRGEFSDDDPAAGMKYAEQIKHVLKEIGARGKKAAAFFAEPLLGCAGQIIPPAGYLKHAYQLVKKAGAVCVADEVQIGFARLGSHFWGFESQGVIPDIVTLGKPIGNGFPLAAVITTAEIARSFDNGMEYFNTFGGNPVSCAVGLAVLDVIENERLQSNALDVGRYILDGLIGLKERHKLIGDVRGLGLFIGMELVRNPSTKEPAADQAFLLTERMKEKGVLLSTDGPFDNVLKIKPPLVISRRDADFFLEQLDVELSTLN